MLAEHAIKKLEKIEVTSLKKRLAPRIEHTNIQIYKQTTSPFVKFKQ